MKTIATTKIEKVENDNNPRLWRSIEHAIMKRHVLLNRVLALGLLAVMVLVPVGQAAQAQGKQPRTWFLRLCSRRQGQPPTRFRAQSMRFALLWAIPTTAITQPPLDRSGHREINWDGGNPNIVDYDTPGNAVQHLPEHPRRAVHHTGHRPFPGADIGRTPRRPCSALQQSDLRHHLQHLQPVAAVHPGGQQHHRSFVSSYPAANGAVPATVTWLRRGLHRC